MRVSILLAVHRFHSAERETAVLDCLSNDNDTVMVIIGILAAIAVPTYLSQRNEAKDTAAQAQLRIAATAQQLYYAKQDTYAASVAALEDYGFRQGGQPVAIKAASGTAYCMQAPGGGSATFRITESTGRPEPGACP
jgi:type II secretory pathway pseudopilin PulG